MVAVIIIWDMVGYGLSKIGDKQWESNNKANNREITITMCECMAIMYVSTAGRPKLLCDKQTHRGASFTTRPALAEQVHHQLPVVGADHLERDLSSSTRAHAAQDIPPRI